MDWVEGQAYTRAEIHDALGGNVQSYLPTVRGRVVACCVTRWQNPDAPGIVLPGAGPGIERAGLAFESQRDPVPTFVCEDESHGWVYVGRWRVVGVSTDKKDLELHGARASRTDVVMVLRLARVGV